MGKLFDMSIMGEGRKGALSFITDILKASTEYSIIYTDTNGKILLWNEGAKRFYGYEPEEMVGKVNVDKLYTPEEIRVRNPTNTMEIAVEHGKWEGTVKRVKKNGEIFIAHSVLTPRYDARHHLIGFLMISRDITAEREVFKELEQFAYRASHDLQEPLRMVQSYIQLLERRYKNKLDKEAHEFIEFAVDGVKRMQQLVNDLLDYSRVTTRVAPLVPVDANQIMNKVLLDLQEQIKERHAKITVDSLPTVMADGIQLYQVFQNLIGNAIKFCKQNPIIHIQCKEEPHEWLFLVKDNGIGIEPEYHEQIFVIFHTLQSQKEYQGTGIGLATCKKIIDRHKGRIWVISDGVGKGSTFYFTIPKMDATS